MQFSGAARRITDDDIRETARRLGCEEAALRAVMAVESRNSGFDARKRPVILFEPHVFWRNLRGAKRETAAAAGLAYAKWGAKPYPKGSDAQYKRLAGAIEIDEEAAFRAVSIGMGQVLGENFAAAGCASARELFAQACESEAAQLSHMAGFIKANRLAPALRAKDWRAFARGYNGPGQVDKYAAWLAREYRKWAERLERAPAPRPPPAPVTRDDLKAAGSRTIAAADEGRAATIGAQEATVGGGATLVGADMLLSQARDIHETVNSGLDTVERGQPALDWLSAHWQWFAIAAMTALAVYLFWRGYRLHRLARRFFDAIEEARVDDANRGVHTGRTAADVSSGGQHEGDQ